MSPDDLTAVAVNLAETAPVVICHGIVERRGEWVCTCQGEADECFAGSPGKHPRTLHGAADATRDAEKLAEWCERFPNSNLALLVGPDTDHLVIETDGPEGGQALDGLLAQLGPFPVTRRSWSGRGYRWHFRGIEGLASQALAEKLELRASHNQYIVVYGRHYSGVEYRTDLEPLAELPLAWREHLSRSATNGAGPVVDGAPIPEGERNGYLTSLLGAARRRGATEAELVVLGLTVNSERCRPPLGEPEVRRIAKSITRYAPTEAARPGGYVRDNGAPTALKTITASTVTPRAVRWFWQGWLPLGMVSLLAGLPGLGKTTFALRIAAEATRGKLDGEYMMQPADVLVASFEDVIDARLVPLLMAADADLDRVHFIACEDAGRVLDLTRHLPEIERLALHHQARLLFIDPLVAAMPAGEMSSHRDQDVRSVLAPLHVLAERHDLAALGTMHFSKSAVDALLGVGGSIGFTGLARSLLIFGADPNDDRGETGPNRILAHRKCNVGLRQASREVFVHPTTVDTEAGGKIDTSTAMLGDESEVSADELVRIKDRSLPPLAQATRWLRALLTDGPHAVEEVHELSEDEGLSWRTVERAKRDLGVTAFQKDRRWWWELSEPEDELPDEQLPFGNPEDDE